MKHVARLARMFLAILPLTACAPAVMSEAPASASSSARREFVVGGHVTGLRGIGLSLRNARGEEIKIDDDGKFVFGSRLGDGSDFEVSVEREPISPVQSCAVTRGTGKIAGRNAMDISVVCSTISLDTSTSHGTFALR
jgi:trimeric autotransporter adhesin